MEPPDNRTRYWVIYCLIFVGCMVGFSLYQLLYLGGWRSYNWMSTLSEVSSSSIGLALLSAASLEGVIYLVLFAPRKARQLREEGRQQGREEGRRQTIEEVREYNAKVIAWETRKDAAQAAGQLFDEPRPELPDSLKD